MAHGYAQGRGLARAFTAHFPAPGEPLQAPPCPPEGLGDQLEALQGPRRKQAFAALLNNQGRAQGQQGLSTTQRFTPAWLADWMARGVLGLATPSPERPCLDPACGGGRLLLSLFDVLVERGATPQHALDCLVGVDLDPLAAQVTRMALWLQAARHPQADPARLRPARVLSLHQGRGELSTLGSLAPWGALARHSEGLLAPGRFAAVVSNPPYMSARHLSEGLRAALKRDFGAFNGDLYTAFLARCAALTHPEGALAVLCQQSFLFVKRDQALRQEFFAQVAPRELLHLGPHTFPGVQGEKAAVVALLATRGPSQAPARVVDLHDLPDAQAKEEGWRALQRQGAAPQGRVFQAGPALARARRGQALVYWLGPKMLDLLDSEHSLGERLEIPGAPHKTADNQRFVRHWWEVDPEHQAAGRWIPYAKGGPRRHWYGNRSRVVDWTPQAHEAYTSRATANQLAERYWFREGITWSDFGGRAFSARWMPPGGAFDMAGPAVLVPQGDELGLWFWLGLLNSQLVCHLLNAHNATIHYQVGDLRRLPIPSPQSLQAHSREVQRLAQLALRATALQQRRAAWTLRDPEQQRPLLHDVDGDTLNERLERAQALLHQQEAELEEIQRQVDALAQRLYDAPGDELAQLSRRDRPPPPGEPWKARQRCLEALDWTVGVAQGRYQAPQEVDASGKPRVALERVAQQLWGEALWAELMQQIGRKGTWEESLSALRRARARWWSRAPWHPGRQRWPLPR